MSSSDTTKQKEDTILAPSREHILGGFVMFLMCLMFVGHNPAAFFWIPFIPLGFIAWTLYVRTTVGDSGIGARYLFRKNRELSWENFHGIRFSRRGRAFAADTNGDTFWLPGVSFNSLSTLGAASGGRIPDPVTPARNAAHDKVQVVHKDGYAVLMDKDEYTEYEAQRRAEAQRNQEENS